MRRQGEGPPKRGLPGSNHGECEKAPPERGAGAGPPAIHAAQHERAGRAGNVSQRGRLYRWPAVCQNRAAATAILHGLARRTAPQTHLPRSGSRAGRWAAQERPRRGDGPAGPELSVYRNWPVVGPPRKLDPSDQSRKRILHKKGPSAKPGPGSQDISGGGRCGQSIDHGPSVSKYMVRGRSRPSVNGPIAA